MKSNDYYFLQIGVSRIHNQTSPTSESHGRNGNIQWEFSGICAYKKNTIGKKGGLGELLCSSLTCLPLSSRGKYVINLTQAWLHQVYISNLIPCSQEYPSTPSPPTCSYVTHKVYLTATYAYLIITILG